ncbi:MAG TPA: DUF3857 domain-containing protein [Stenotrophomonas sp.]
MWQWLAPVLAWVGGLWAACPAWAGDAPAMAAAPSWVREEAVPSTGPGSGGLRYELVSDQLDLTGTQPLWYRRVSYTVQRDGALADAGQVAIDYQPDFQRMLLNHLEVWRDGRRLDLRHDAHYAQLRRESELEEGLLDGALTVNISLPDLRVGDRIDYGYTVAGDNPVFGQGYYDRYTARYGVPVAARRLRVRYPAALPLHWRISVPGFSERQERFGEVRELRLEADALPSVSAEKGAPEGYDAFGRIELSTAADWHAVADWALSLYPQGFSDPAVAHQVASQLQLSRDDPQGSLQRAIAFVQGEVRYLGLEMGANSHAPHAPEETLRLRYGDCKDKATLLVALLALAGIPAEPVLVNSAPGVDLATYLPSPLAFDHVVVRARPPGGRPVWVDATRDREMGDLQARVPLPFGQGLPVAAGSSRLVDIPYPRAIEPDVEVRQDVALQMRSRRRGADFMVSTEYRRNLGDEARDQFERDGADAVGEHYLDYMRNFYDALQQVRPPQVDDSDPASVRIDERYRLEWPASEGDVIGFPLFQLRDWMKELPHGERRTPLALGGPRLATQTVHLHSDVALGVKPQREEVVANPWFRFSRRVEVDGREVSITGRWERLALQIPPQGLRRAARDMKRAREMAYFEHDFKPDPWREIGLRPWLQAMAAFAVTAMGLVVALVSWARGGIGGMLYAPQATAGRLATSPGLRWQAWFVFVVGWLTSAIVVGHAGAAAVAGSIGAGLGILVLTLALLWGALRVCGVNVDPRRLLQATIAGQAPQLPFLAGMATALAGGAGWLSGAAPQPREIPGLVMAAMLASAAMCWYAVSMWLGVSGATGASRQRVLAAWACTLAIGAMLAIGAAVASYLLRH